MNYWPPPAYLLTDRFPRQIQVFTYSLLLAEDRPMKRGPGAAYRTWRRAFISGWTVQ